MASWSIVEGVKIAEAVVAGMASLKKGKDALSFEDNRKIAKAMLKEESVRTLCGGGILLLINIDVEA